MAVRDQRVHDVPSRLTRLLPRLITALAVVHLVYVVAESPDVIADMIDDGVVGAGDGFRRDYVIWMTIGGMALLTFGAVTAWMVRAIGRIPAFLGWWMAAIGVFDSTLEPNGGGWIILLLGAFVVYEDRRSRRSDPSTAASHVRASRSESEAVLPEAVREE